MMTTILNRFCLWCADKTVTGKISQDIGHILPAYAKELIKILFYTSMENIFHPE